MGINVPPNKKFTRKATILWVTACIIHLVLFACTMELFFQSPISTGMSPHKTEHAFAKRVVIFVCDGLRAETIYPEEHINRVPYLSQLRLEGESAWGLSHTHVPTETRPGHVALLGGMYEDPSAIFAGWSANIVEVDSVINQSNYAWSYGSPDIVNIFQKKDASKLHVEAYNASAEDFSGGTSTINLDSWVFDKVENLLKDNKNSCGNLCEDGNVFLLHLLGMDSAGHVHKPNSYEYIENLEFVDNGVRDMVSKFKEFYGDEETVFVFTSDHGMTDWGSHGDGSDHETKTPFILWGKGIKTSFDMQHIQQADIAPLIATLVGINIPVNSVGVLPYNVLGGTAEAVAEAIYANLAQLSETYQIIKDSFKYDLLSRTKIGEYPDSTKILENLSSLIQKSLYQKAIEIGMNSIKYVLDTTVLMQNQYFWYKLATVICGFILWIIYLGLSLAVLNDQIKMITHTSKFYASYESFQFKAISGLVGCFSVVASYLSCVDASGFAYIYILFPTIIIIFTIQNPDLIDKFIKCMECSCAKKMKFIIAALKYAFLIECLVVGFFYKPLYAVVILGIGCWMFGNRELSKKNRIRFLLFCVFIAIYILVPANTSFSYWGLFTGGCMWFWLYFGTIAFNIGDFVKIHENNRKNMFAILLCVTISLFIFSMANAFTVAFYFDNNSGIPMLCQVLSWIFSIVALLIIPLYPRGLLARFGQISACFLIPYTLMSGHFDVVFYALLTTLMHIWIETEATLIGELKQLFYAKFGKSKSPSIPATTSDVYRRTFFFLALVIICFFITGDVASLSNFDPLWTRAYVSTFSPILMCALIVFKLLAPVFVVTAAFVAINTISNTNVQMTFTIIVLFCDVMVLNFIVLIKNTGSWKEIGTSLTHFVIMEVMVFVLLVFYALASAVTNMRYFRTNDDDDREENLLNQCAEPELVRHASSYELDARDARFVEASSSYPDLYGRRPEAMIDVVSEIETPESKIRVGVVKFRLPRRYRDYEPDDSSSSTTLNLFGKAKTRADLEENVATVDELINQTVSDPPTNRNFGLKMIREREWPETPAHQGCMLGTKEPFPFPDEPVFADQGYPPELPVNPFEKIRLPRSASSTHCVDKAIRELDDSYITIHSSPELQKIAPTTVEIIDETIDDNPIGDRGVRSTKSDSDSSDEEDHTMMAGKMPYIVITKDARGSDSGPGSSTDDSDSDDEVILIKPVKKLKHKKTEGNAAAGRMFQKRKRD